MIKSKTIYVSPEVVSVGLNTEGMLCASPWDVLLGGQGDFDYNVTEDTTWE